MRTSQVRRLLLVFSLLAFVCAPCLSTHAPVASADPTWVPIFDDMIVASIRPGNGAEIRIVEASKGPDLENAVGGKASYDRLDAVLSDLAGVTAVRTDGCYVAGSAGLSMLAAAGLTNDTDLPSDVAGLSHARRSD